ncbi:MAG: DUF4832 domain-containing protein [Defluviitaleaceae bacterium]|nr:DUF4832 domain-containing protein [Defluviitaleaceae bacterium]
MRQKLNYTENPVDIPNPDRGFVRSNDDGAGNGAYSDIDAGSARWGYMTIPADASTILGQPFQLAYEMTPPYYLGGASKGPEYCNVPVEPRILQFYLVLNNFSSNAWCQCTEGIPDNHTRVGTDGPITDYGLAYLKEQFEFIRTQTNSVAHIRVCYDPKGWNHVTWTGDNLRYEDGTIGNRLYQCADYAKPVAPENFAAHLAKPGAGTWRGSTPFYRMCTVPGFTDLNWVQYHYKQLEPIFHEYADVIWAFDSGTFGPWGETHSNYEAEMPGNYKIILDSLLAAVPDGKPIMTHIGGFLDWYNRTYDTTYDFGTLDKFPDIVRGTPEARFGMFCDSVGWSADEYAHNNGGSLTEGYRMLAHDPILPGYNPVGVDPSLIREETAAPGGRVGAVIGYNDSGTNRLLPIPEAYDDTMWRGAWFADWDRTKLMDFVAKMSVYGGEVTGIEPDLIDGKPNNGAHLAVGSRIDSPYNDVILRFPFVLHEHSIARWTYMCIQQAHGSFKSRADYLYTRENIEVEITYPWSGEKVKVFYDPLYEGQSALAYFRDRMGFRFVLREANVNESVEPSGILKFAGKIQNVGWGNVFNKKRVSVLLQPTGGEGHFSKVIDADPRDWLAADDGNSRADNVAAWRDFSFAINMKDFGNIPPGEYNIFLKINDPKETSPNKRCIRFANHDIWNDALGANLIGSTTCYS